MNQRTSQEQARFWDLRAAYDDAFRHLSAQVLAGQSLAGQSSPDLVAVREAGIRTEDARRAYRTSRDALADLMMSWPSETAGEPRVLTEKGVSL